MTRFGLALTTLALASTLPSFAADRHYSIRAESVAAAMSGVGMQVSPRQVTLLTEVVATSNAPRLRVRSIEKSGDHRMMVRIECEKSEECLPFYASIGSGAGNESQASEFTLPAQDYFSRQGNSKQVEMRLGSTATLLLDGQRVHISLSVICLENGAVGQKIRVASADRQRTYLAEVIDSGRLKGSLQ